MAFCDGMGVASVSNCDRVVIVERTNGAGCDCFFSRVETIEKTGQVAKSRFDPIADFSSRREAGASSRPIG